MVRVKLNLKRTRYIGEQLLRKFRNLKILGLNLQGQNFQCQLLVFDSMLRPLHSQCVLSNRQEWSTGLQQLNYQLVWSVMTLT